MFTSNACHYFKQLVLSIATSYIIVLESWLHVFVYKTNSSVKNGLNGSHQCMIYTIEHGEGRTNR